MTREWRRVLFGWKPMLLLLLLAAASVYQMYDAAVRDNSEIFLRIAVYQETEKELEKMEPDERGAYLRELISQCEEEMQSSEDAYRIYQYQAAYEMLQSQVQYLESYPSYLGKIKSDAARILAGGVFGSPEGYSANNARKTAADFESLGEVSVELGAVYGIEQIWQQDLSGYFAVIFMLYLVLRMMKERKRGLWEMVYAGKNGRLVMAGNRVGILFAAAAISVGVLYFTRIITAFCLFGGWDTLQLPVQSAQTFQKCILPLNMRQMLLLTGVLHTAAVFVTAVFFWMVFILVSHDKLAMALLAALTAVEYMLYTGISASSSLLLLKGLNLFSLWDIQNLMSSYQNYRFGEIPVGQYALAIAFAGIVLVVSLTAASAKSCLRRPKNVSSLPQRLIEWLQKRLLVLVGRAPALFTELYKLIVYERGWLVLVVWVYLAYTVFSGRIALYYESKEQIRDRVYAETDGMDLFLAGRYLTQATEENDAEMALLIQAEEDFAAGRLDYDGYQTVMHQHQYAPVRQDVYQSFAQELERLELLEAAAGRQIHIVYPYGYTKLGGRLDLSKGYDQAAYQRRKLWMLYQLAALLFLFAGMFPYERSSHMTKLLLASANGRNRLWHRKKCAAALCVSVLWLAGTLMQWMQVSRSGASFGGFLEPAAVLPCFSGFPVWLSVGAVMAGICLLRLMLLLAMTGIVLGISAYSKNLPTALGIGCLVLLLPACVEYLTGISGLPLSVTDGLQLLYDKGWRGAAAIVCYGCLGIFGYLSAKG